MRKYLHMMIAVWVLTLGLLFLYQRAYDRDAGYMVEVNRLHEQNMSNLQSGKGIAERGGRVSAVEVIRLRELSGDTRRIFFSGADLEEKEFVILPVKDTDYLIRYAIRSRQRDNGLMYVLLSAAPFLFLWILFHWHRRIEIPLQEMSVIPEQLAKGQFIFETKQYKNKLFHTFLWGLDMLRVKLDEQRDMNMQLEKERRTLVASLSHDIKTPLSSIINYGMAIEDGVYETKEEIDHAVKVLLDKAAKIQSLTDELLSASVNAIEEMKVSMSEAYTEQICQAIDKTVANRMEQLKLHYRMESFCDNLMIQVDMDRIIEVCDNIAENAIKYGDLGHFTIQMKQSEQYLLISFENTGDSIAETEIKHIFSSFYRGSNAEGVQGHGLGLYIVKKIMRAMGGDVYVENTDTGVRVVIVLRR